MASETPEHILILGSGVFALTTLWELLQRPAFANVTFSLVSPTLEDSSTAASVTQPNSSTAPSDANVTASYDTTRIIRADYADPAYADLMREAHALWRNSDFGWGADGRYNEAGLLLSVSCAAAGGSAKYLPAALANAKDLERKAGLQKSSIQELHSADDVQRAMGAAKEHARGTGDSGYLNKAAAWADASACTSYLLRRIRAASNGRVAFYRAAATRLTISDDGHRIAGCTLDRAPGTIAAGLTVLATGAWTPALLDTRGVASVRAQSIAYVPLSDTEATALTGIPVHINLASGCYLFPPVRGTGARGTWEVKVAQHSYGYAPPAARVRPVRVDADGETVHAVARARLPFFPDALPPADAAKLRDFVADALPCLADVAAPDPAARRAWTTRICYYLDTASGDFIVARHPAFRSSLFVATGGSGHAFKFLPALGTRIVDVLDGADERNNAGLWTRKWRWPARESPLPKGDPGEVWCEDGSRAGVAGKLLEDVLDDTRDRDSRL